MRGFVLGVLLTLLALVVGGYMFVHDGKVSMATTAQPLPLEQTVAHMALRASIGSAKDLKNPLLLGEADMIAGAKIYKDNCAQCHGAPQQSAPAISKGMFPPPPRLFESKDMVTDDPEGEIYWKVTHGIRLTGMPGFANILSDKQRWQVTMLVAHANKLPSSAQAAFGH